VGKDDRMLSQDEIDNLLKGSDDFQLDIEKISKDLFEQKPITKNKPLPITPVKLKQHPLLKNDIIYVCEEDGAVLRKNIMYRSYPASPRLVLSCPTCNSTIVI
jgi:hypothetical protein